MAALWRGEIVPIPQNSCVFCVWFWKDSGKTVSPFPSKGQENDLSWIVARLMWLRLKTARGKSRWYCVVLTTSLSYMWESLRSSRWVGLVVSGKGEKYPLIAETRRVLTQPVHSYWNIAGLWMVKLIQRPHWERNTWKVSGTIVLQTEYIIHSYAWDMSSTCE